MPHSYKLEMGWCLVFLGIKITQANCCAWDWPLNPSQKYMQPSRETIIWQHSDPLLTGREGERGWGTEMGFYISTWNTVRHSSPCFAPILPWESYVLPLWRTKSIIQHIGLCDGAKEPLFTVDQSPSTESRGEMKEGKSFLWNNDIHFLCLAMPHWEMKGFSLTSGICLFPTRC